MVASVTFPAPILPTACYTVEQVAALLGVGTRTVERWPLSWFSLGHRTRRVMGRDLLLFLAIARERDTGLSAEDLVA